MSLFRIVTYVKFEPSMLTNLKLWLDASVLTGANDSSVSNWTDQSGNGADFLQSVSSYQPKLKTNLLNNQNVVRFDGVDDFLFNQTSLDMLKNKSGCTIFVVAKYPATFTNNRSISISDGINSYYSRAKMQQGSSQLYLATGKRLDSESEDGASSSAFATNTFVVHQGEFDYANATATQSINGVVDGYDSTFATSGSTSNTDSITLNVGARYQSPSTVFTPNSTLYPRPDNYMDGDIAEICVFDRILTSLEKSYMNSYFNAKWNL